MKPLIVFLLATMAVRAEDFKLRDGTEYKGVTVVREEKEALVIETDSGIATIKFKDLPEATQKAYGWTSPQARAQEAARLAEDARKTNELIAADIARAKARKLATADIGETPIVLPNSPPSCVVRYLKSRLKDPDSLKFSSVGSPSRTWHGDEACWRIGVEYRARNSFGGYTSSYGIAYLVKGSVIDYDDVRGKERAREYNSGGGDYVVSPDNMGGVQVRQLPSGVSHRQSIGGGN